MMKGKKEFNYKWEILVAAKLGLGGNWSER